MVIIAATRFAVTWQALQQALAQNVPVSELGGQRIIGIDATFISLIEIERHARLGLCG